MDLHGVQGQGQGSTGTCQTHKTGKRKNCLWLSSQVPWLLEPHLVPSWSPITRDVAISHAHSYLTIVVPGETPQHRDTFLGGNPARRPDNTPVCVLPCVNLLDRGGRQFCFFYKGQLPILPCLAAQNPPYPVGICICHRDPAIAFSISWL